MDAIQSDPPRASRDVRDTARDELVRSLVAAGVSILAGMALLWAMTHTSDIARGAAWLRVRATAPAPPGPPPQYWDMLPGLHRDIRRFEQGHGRMIKDPGGPGQ